MKYNFLLGFAIGAAASITSPASAQNGVVYENDAFGLINVVELILDDQVEGQCWTNGDTIRARVRLDLENSGIKVEEDGLAFGNVFGRRVLISALGFRANDICSVSLVFSVRHSASTTFDKGDGSSKIVVYASAYSFVDEGLFVNPRNVNQQALNFFDRAVAEFAADVVTARRSEVVQAFRKAFPNLGKNYLSRPELERMLKDAGSTD